MTSRSFVSPPALANASRRSAIAVVVAGIALSGVGVLHAQPSYPSKPVRIIVPFSAGTSPDVIARMWSERFAKATGQAAVVENRPGASTSIAAQAVAVAPADGYTLLWTVNNTFSINPYVHKKLPYKADDFVPVTQILSVPYVLVVSAESKVRTLEDLAREAKSKPGAMSYGSPGIGTGPHVAMARFLNMAGVSMTHVPYKDYFGPDLIAQRLDVAFDATTTALAHIKGGKFRALGVSSPKRIDALPGVPAIAETYPGFVGDSWMGIFAPKGTPDNIVATIVAQSQRIVESPDFRAALLRDYGLTPAGSSSEAFRSFLAEDARAWAKVVKDNSIVVE